MDLTRTLAEITVGEALSWMQLAQEAHRDTREAMLPIPRSGETVATYCDRGGEVPPEIGGDWRWDPWYPCDPVPAGGWPYGAWVGPDVPFAVAP